MKSSYERADRCRGVAWKQGWTNHGAAPVEIVLPWPLMKKPDGARRDEQTDPLPRF